MTEDLYSGDIGWIVLAETKEEDERYYVGRMLETSPTAIRLGPYYCMNNILGIDTGIEEVERLEGNLPRGEADLMNALEKSVILEKHNLASLRRLKK